MSTLNFDNERAEVAAVRSKLEHANTQSKQALLKKLVHLWHLAQKHQTLDDGKNDRLGGYTNNELVRKIHDFFGWMAKDNKNVKGRCKGALYRSRGFIEIIENDRDGRKKTQTIHIEHVVPVKVVNRLIFEYAKRIKRENFNDFILFVMALSVCTAVTYRDEKEKIERDKPERSLSRLTSSHPEFMEPALLSIKALKKKHPFARYAGSEIEVYKVSDGSLINPGDYTFRDHLKELEANRFNIFSWLDLEDQLENILTSRGYC